MRTVTTMMASVALLVSATAVYAQNDQDQSWNCPKATSGKTQTTAGIGLYNTQTVQTIQGEILKVEQKPGRFGLGHGVHLLVKTEMGKYPVWLGPEWFIKDHNVQFKPNDQVKIKGSRVTINGKEAFIASQIKDQNQLLTLRDDNGRPVWAGNPGLSMTGRGSGNMYMTSRREHWIGQHEKVVESLKKMDAELKQKVEAMNQAQGQDKVKAMAAAINELAKQREAIDKHIEQFAQRGLDRMQRRQEMMSQRGMGQRGMMGQGGMGNSTATSSGHSQWYQGSE